MGECLLERRGVSERHIACEFSECVKHIGQTIWRLWYQKSCDSMEVSNSNSSQCIMTMC